MVEPRLSDNLDMAMLKLLIITIAKKKKERTQIKKNSVKMKLTTKPIILHKIPIREKPVETIDLGNTEDDSRDSNESGSADEDLESDLSNENENHLEVRISMIQSLKGMKRDTRGERKEAGIGLEFYSNNELLDFAATALLQGKIHEHKSKHSQSGYIADSEFTDTNVPVLHSPNTETEEGKQSQLNNQNNNISTVHSSKKSNESSTRISYRSEDLPQFLIHFMLMN